MPFLRKPVLLVALLLELTSFLQSQHTDDCEKRPVTVNVLDHAGNLVAGLSTPSFRAKMRGHTVTVSSANVGRSPRIVLLLDASGSMIFPKPKWEVAKLAVENLVTSTRGNAHLALVLFANDVLETLDFGHSPEEILQRIQQLGDAEKLVPSGKRTTALMDSLIHALSLFGTPVPGDAVYVVSDGGDNTSRASSDEVEHVLLAKGVRFYAFSMSLLNERFLHAEESERAAPMLTRLAERTGGRVVYLESVPVDKPSPQLEASLRRAYDQITQFYELSLGPLKSLDKEQGWELEVVDSQGKRRKDLDVMYPRKLPACSVSTADKGQVER